VEAIVTKIGNSLSIAIPDDFKDSYHLRGKMVFEISAEKEEIILKPKKKSMREKLAGKFNSINIDEFEKYKRNTLSTFLNMPSRGMEILDEE